MSSLNMIWLNVWNNVCGEQTHILFDNMLFYISNFPPFILLNLLRDLKVVAKWLIGTL